MKIELKEISVKDVVEEYAQNVKNILK